MIMLVTQLTVTVQNAEWWTWRGHKMCRGLKLKTLAKREARDDVLTLTLPVCCSGPDDRVPTTKETKGMQSSSKLCT